MLATSTPSQRDCGMIHYSESEPGSRCASRFALESVAGAALVGAAVLPYGTGIVKPSAPH